LGKGNLALFLVPNANETMARKKQDTGEKAKGNPCAAKASPLARALAIILLCATWLGSMVWAVTEFRDWNRYELYLFQGYEATVAYKLDKKTGKVTGIFNLHEYDVEKFKDDGHPQTAHWNWAFQTGEHFLPMPLEERQ